MVEEQDTSSLFHRSYPKFSPSENALDKCREVLISALQTNVKIWVNELVRENGLDAFAYMAFNKEARLLQTEGKLRLIFDHRRGLWFVTRPLKVCSECTDSQTCHKVACQQIDASRSPDLASRTKKAYKHQNSEYTRADMKEIDIETYINTGSKSGAPRKDWILAKAASVDPSKLDAAKLERVTKKVYEVITLINVTKAGSTISGPKLAAQLTEDIKYMDIYVRTALVNLVNSKQIKALVPSDSSSLQVRWGLGDVLPSST